MIDWLIVAARMSRNVSVRGSLYFKYSASQTETHKSMHSFLPENARMIKKCEFVHFRVGGVKTD